MKVKMQRRATTLVELTSLSAMNADRTLLELQLLDITTRFAEAVAKAWGVNPNTMQVTVTKERDFAHDVEKFLLDAFSSPTDEELDVTTPDPGEPLSLLRLQSKMAMLGFKV